MEDMGARLEALHMCCEGTQSEREEREERQGRELRESEEMRPEGSDLRAGKEMLDEELAGLCPVPPMEPAPIVVIGRDIFVTEEGEREDS